MKIARRDRSLDVATQWKRHLDQYGTLEGNVKTSVDFLSAIIAEDCTDTLSYIFCDHVGLCYRITREQAEQVSRAMQAARKISDCTSHSADSPTGDALQSQAWETWLTTSTVECVGTVDEAFANGLIPSKFVWPRGPFANPVIVNG